MDSPRLFARKTEFAVTGEYFDGGLTADFEIMRVSSIGCPRAEAKPPPTTH
jgi:hypothetical protein